MLNTTRTNNAFAILRDAASGEIHAPVEMRWAAQKVANGADASNTLANAKEALREADTNGMDCGLRWAIRTLREAGCLSD